MEAYDNEAEFYLGMERCDSCNATSVLMMQCPDGDHQLNFCQHHGNRLVINLLMRAWTVLHDLREWKAEGVTAQPVPAS